MADDVQDIYVSTDAGTEWQSLSALAAEQVDAKLPIESVDGTVVLSDSSASFVVSTGGAERVKVASGGQLLVGDTTLESANFNVHVRGDDNVQICIDATAVGATTGAVLKLRSGDDKYWNIQHTQNVAGSTEDNQLVIGNGGSAFLRAYQDNTAVFGGQIRTPSVRGPADNDASVTLGNQATLKAGNGSEYVPTDSASIATKKIVDDKIWVGTTAQYLNIPPRDILPTTLYCLTD